MKLTRPTFAFLAAAVAVILLDLATKLVVYHTLSLDAAPVPLLGDYLRLTYIHNAGAAFGLFQGSRWFFILVSALSILVILALAVSERYAGRWLQVSFGLILGGAVGNLADRIWLGVVIDFIQMGIPPRHYWPVYNVADIGVTVGVVLLSLCLLQDGKNPASGEVTDKVGSVGGEA